MAKHFKDLNIRGRKKDARIGVIAGGNSSEREVSLNTGTKIFEALQGSGYLVEFIDLNEISIKRLNSIDIAFLALHGRYGEDGTIQGMLELLRIPYTGSGVLSSSVVIDKIMTKKLLLCEGLPTPPFAIFDTKYPVSAKDMDKKIEQEMGYPVIIKPNREGSTIGVTIVRKPSQLKAGLDEASNHDDLALVEKFIEGRELTSSILGIEPVALPIIEIRPKSGFYDYKSKYTANMTEYIVPAELDEQISIKINDIALKSHRLLQCSAISRVDFILGRDDIPYVLEVNTMPGMTPTSLVPKAAAAAGINFGLLVEIILNHAHLKI